MERTFEIRMTEDERLMNLAALGFAYIRLPKGEPATILDSLIVKLSRTPGRDAPPITPTNPGTASGTQTAKDILAPAPRNYFAKDRKGNTPSGPPEGAELKTVKILQAQEKTSTTPGKASFLQVVFTGGKGNCFDSSLWPHIVKLTGQDAALYLIKAGNYTNIVGVRT